LPWYAAGIERSQSARRATGLSRAAELGITDLQVRADSKIVIFQMSGTYKVKAKHLAALRDEARRVASRIGKGRVVHLEPAR
jgi:Reverse transcriptase-like